MLLADDSHVPALKVLAQQLNNETVPEQGGRFRLGALPLFDRVWVQGTVQRKVAGSLKLDDGTGSIDCTVSGAGGGPGVEIDSIGPGTFVLVQGKLQARQVANGPRQFTIKAQKLLNLSAACGEDVAQRMMHWGVEVAELQRLLEAEAAAAAAAEQHMA